MSPLAVFSDHSRIAPSRAQTSSAIRSVVCCVLPLEVGGRWSEEAVNNVRLLSKAKARTVPQLLRPAARAALFHRWTGIFAVAAQRALAATLLELPSIDAGGVDGDTPSPEDVLGEAQLTEAPAPSRPTVLSLVCLMTEPLQPC